LTYSFPTAANQYQTGYGSGTDFASNPSGFIAFNAAQQAAANYALSLIFSYTLQTFTQITETTTTHATFRFAQTSDATLLSAHAWFPANLNQAGDVWFGTSTGQPFYLTPAPGNWGQATVMHELGHAMGLKHGHQNYTNLDLRFALDPSGANARWGSQTLPANHNGQSWSLMTYASDPGDPSGNTFQGDGFNQPQTYMQDDIAALQFLYGAWFGYNSDNTVYTFSTTTGQMSINGVGQPAPTGNIIYRTIWDGDGIDTYNLSNYSTSLNINLNPGAFSNFGMQLANNRPISGGPVFAPGNIANALLYKGDVRSLIENVIGGSNNDILTGNWANNTFRGALGNDTIDGADGFDSAIFAGLRSAYTLTVLGGGSVRVSGPDGIDTLTRVERLVFDDQTVPWFPPQTVSFGAPGSVLNAFGTGGGWNSQNTYPRELADINNDGAADIVGFATNGVYVSLANGTGGNPTARGWDFVLGCPNGRLERPGRLPALACGRSRLPLGRNRRLRPGRCLRVPRRRKRGVSDPTARGRDFVLGCRNGRLEQPEPFPTRAGGRKRRRLRRSRWLRPERCLRVPGQRNRGVSDPTVRGRGRDFVLGYPNGRLAQQ